MRILDIIDVDCVNYKKPSMFISTIKCNGKCNRDCGRIVCQNYELSIEESKHIIDYDNEKIWNRYKENHLTEAIVFGGLEPLDQIDELLDLIDYLRTKTDDDIVIYTGYKYDEIKCTLMKLLKYKNIIVKVGRYIDNHISVYDSILGVTLASNNQYAFRIESLIS